MCCGRRLSAEQICIEDGYCAPPRGCDGEVTPYALGTLVVGTTNGANGGERSSCGGGNPSRIFSMVAPQNGAICISLAGSDYDTVLHVRENLCLGQEVACNDDFVDTRSQVELDATAGTEYFIIIDGWRDSGDFRMTAVVGECDAVQLPNCSAEVPCDDGERCDENGVCAATCLGDADCQDREICEPNGLCAPGCRELANGENTCPGEEFCLDGQCRNCREDAACGDEAICVDNICLPGCRDDAGCLGLGVICSEENLCVPGCRNDEGCPIGRLCGENGLCVEGCRNDAGCPSGRICGDNGRCRFGCRVDDGCDQAHL